MKIYATLTYFLFATFLQLFPQQTPSVSLNGTWAFKTDMYQVGEHEKWYEPDTPIEGWDKMEVPGVWDTRNEYADYAGTAWYRTDFVADSDWEEKWVRLIFEAVYNDVKVWLNGKLLGEHHVGFLPFHFDIIEHLKMGEENTLVLSVDNTFKRGAIWNWGGIRRPVELEITERVRLEHQHITAIPDLEQGTADIEVSFEVSNFDRVSTSISCEFHITKGEKEIGTIQKKTLELSPNATAIEAFSLSLPAEQVKLWHVDFPHLYHAHLKIFKDGKEIHALNDRFGIRKIEVDGLELKLNGEAIRPVGFNVVPEDRTTGNTLPLSRIKEDVDLLKQMGVNMTRLSHLPLPKAYLDYLDEKGIMVFEEVSLWGKDVMVDPQHPLPKYWLKKMIETKFNHPSVIGWSVGNEIGYLNANPKVMEYVSGAIREAKQYDPHRLAVYVTHSAQSQQEDPVKFSDLILLNRYGTWGESADKAHALHPGKPIFYSEYGKELNHEDPNKSHIDAQAILDSYRNKEHVIGGSLWTFNDYRSFWQASPTWSTPPSQNRSWGVVNVFRQKKQAFYTFRREYAPVKSLRVEDGTVTITPRSKWDIPANTLRNYQLLVTIWEGEDQLVDGKFVSLPTLHPGDSPWKYSLAGIDGGRQVKVELLDPQCYSVWDTTLYAEVPPSPKIKAIHTSNNQARVIFEKVDGATSYVLRYGEGNLDKISSPTINDFIEVGALTYGNTYQFALVAINGAGESEPSPIQTANTDEDELPPVIWKTVAADQSFFIGYTVDRRDYLYDIQYGTAPGEYDHQIGVRNVGVCQVPHLKNGTTYYYRFRRRMQWGFASEWSDERSVTPHAGTTSLIPVQALHQKDQAMILFDPVEGAIGYQLAVQSDSGSNQTIAITSAQSGRYLVEGLKENQKYQFTLTAIRE